MLYPRERQMEKKEEDWSVQPLFLSWADSNSNAAYLQVLLLKIFRQILEM